MIRFNVHVQGPDSIPHVSLSFRQWKRPSTDPPLTNMILGMTIDNNQSKKFKDLNRKQRENYKKEYKCHCTSGPQLYCNGQDARLECGRSWIRPSVPKTITLICAASYHKEQRLDGSE